jgi:peptidoglycan-N-acetylglucosamine deacetylase
LAKRAHGAGHRIGNHTFSHTIPLGDRPGDEAIREIVRTEELINELATSPPTFRPFGRGGAIGPHLVGQPAADHLMEHCYTLALWNNVPGDWHDIGWLETCLSTLATQDWSVVVLHDMAEACLSRLPEFLDRLRDLEADITLELPIDCCPIIAGRPTTSFEALQLPPP